MAFGVEVARLRREAGWSIERVAGRAGVLPKTIMNIESTKEGLRLSKAHALARRLAVPISELTVPMCARSARRRR